MALFNKTVTALRNLFSKPATRLYPAEKRDPPPGTRGCLAIDIETCIFCGICQKKCPTDSLRVEREAKRWSIDRLSCIACAYCVDVCPKNCLSMEVGHSPAMRTRDRETHAPAGKSPTAV